jgi:hypothetical protein
LHHLFGNRLCRCSFVALLHHVLLLIFQTLIYPIQIFMTVWASPSHF